MSMKKQIMAFAAAGALVAATAVPAMALENEFHGMYKFFAYQSNGLNGADGQVTLAKDAHSGFFAENRARLLYQAKANDNLKLVTHFELDTRFGGRNTAAAAAGGDGGYKGTVSGNDSGNLDADQLTLETKNVYLDFNVPMIGTNFKTGSQPWADAYNSLFLLADMTGVYATKKVIDPLTVSLGWFRFNDQDTKNSLIGAGRKTADLFVLDGKFAVSKDLTVGASYYNIQNDTSAIAATTGTTAPTVTAGTAAVSRVPAYDLLHMIGVNADIKVGPAAVKPFAAFQFGELNGTNNIYSYLAGATAKCQAGPGTFNLATFYLSGDANGTGTAHDFKTVTAATTYFNPANMWLLIRNGQQVNTSTSVLNNDMTVGGRGSFGIFAGYEGTAGKVFYNANAGYMRTAEKRGSEDQNLGTEINAQVGYKIFDNLSASVAAAYLVLGDGLSSSDDTKRVGGAKDADNPYMLNVQLSYVF